MVPHFAARIELHFQKNKPKDFRRAELNL